MEKSCGAVLFRIENGKRLYLILHYEEGHWDFPKGHVEKGEGEHEAAVRETIEETGIGDMDFVAGFRERIEYNYLRDGKKLKKEAIFFLARTETSDVTLSGEHTGFAWLRHEDAAQRITYENSRRVLEKAESHVKKTAGESGP
jgi:8-oxo-dGTP pyrophosphatase MutT (NUDIX family)